MDKNSEHGVLNECLYYDLETITDPITKRMKSNLAVLCNSKGEINSFWHTKEKTAADLMVEYLIELASKEDEKKRKKRIIIGM